MIRCAVLVVALVGASMQWTGAAARAAEGTFPDVPASSPFLDAIEWLANSGVTGGYADGTFRPTSNITRQGMAAFLHRFDQATTAGPDAGFSDVSPTHPFADEIWWMADAGITGGYSDGTFRPAAVITRGAMAAFLYRQAGRPDGLSPTCSSAAFPDVGVSHPFCAEITWMVDAGITGGFSDGTFRPASGVTRQAMAAFLHRLAGSPSIDDPGTNRADPAVTTILDGDEVASQSRAGSTATITLRPGAEVVPAVGDPVVMDTTDAVPEGVIGRVTSVGPGTGGTTIVALGPVALNEVIPRASYAVSTSASGEPGAEPIAPRSASTGAPIPLASPCTGGALSGSFSPTLDLDLDVTASWGLFEDTVLRAELTTTVGASASAQATAGSVCERDLELPSIIPTVSLPPIPLPGPLPPVIPEISWGGSASAEVTATVDFTASATASATIGAEYRNGTVTPITEAALSGSAEMNAAGPAGQLRLFAGPRLSALVGGVLGLYVEAGPFLEVTADPLATTRWSVEAGVDGGLGLMLDLWFLGEVEYELGRATVVSRTLAADSPLVGGVQRLSVSTGGTDLSDTVYLASQSSDGMHVMLYMAATDRYLVRDVAAGTTTAVPASYTFPAMFGDRVLALRQEADGDEELILWNPDTAAVTPVSDVDTRPGCKSVPEGVCSAWYWAKSHNERYIVYEIGGGYSSVWDPDHGSELPRSLMRYDASTGTSVLIGYEYDFGFGVYQQGMNGRGLENLVTDTGQEILGASSSDVGAAVMDLSTLNVTIVSRGPLGQPTDAWGQMMSADGRYVAYLASDPAYSSLTPGSAVFLRDRVTGSVQVVSVAPDGSALPVSNDMAGMSADGQLIAFTSLSDESVWGNREWVRDRSDATTTPLGMAAAEPVGINGWLSSDGQVFAFDSLQAHTSDDLNGRRDTYLQVVP